MYTGDLTDLATWREGVVAAAPYLLGIAAAGMALGLAQRPHEAKSRKAKTA